MHQPIHYMAHGCEETEKGLRLGLSRDVGTGIYRTLPHHLGSLTHRQFPVLIGFLGSDCSIECRRAGWTAIRRLIVPHFWEIRGDHLFSMEHSENAAEAVHKMIQLLLD